MHSGDKRSLTFDDKRVVGILLECILVCNFQIHCGYEGPMSSDKEICNQISRREAQEKLHVHTKACFGLG